MLDHVLGLGALLVTGMKPDTPPFSPLPPLCDTGRRDHGRSMFALSGPLNYATSVIRVHVPAGAETDLASIPRMLRHLLWLDGPYCRAAIVHDYLYGCGVCSRFLADAVLRQAMADLRVPVWCRILVFYSVRLFGWLRYAKAQKALQRWGP